MSNKQGEPDIDGLELDHREFMLENALENSAQAQGKTKEEYIKEWEATWKNLLKIKNL